jgi:bacillithiol system protein YtxJ
LEPADDGGQEGGGGSMAAIVQLTDAAQWRRLLAARGTAVVFKHSTTCPISARAHAEFEAWAADLEDDGVGLYRVHVIEDRPLSLQVAADTAVAHQSPQALLLRNGKVLWHASHYAITRQALAAALAAPEATPSRSTSLFEARRAHAGA